MGVLAEVRSQTHSVHQSLDDHPLLVQFMSQGNLEAYQHFLQTFRMFLERVESQADAFVSAEDREVFEYASWIEALKNDLETLPAPDHLDATTLLPEFSSKSQFWGLMYVMEGSVLGGVQVASVIPADWPMAFLKRGANSRLRWPSFCRRLGELEAAGEISSAGVKRGAIQAFTAMIKIFDTHLQIDRSGTHSLSSLSYGFSGDRSVPGDMG